MLFLDVTQSCRSSNNSGIQVVTRNLFRELDKLREITPMTWDSRLRSYVRLNRNELHRLANPFSANYRPRSRPNKEENPIVKELIATLLRLSKRISLVCKPDRKRPPPPPRSLSRQPSPSPSNVCMRNCGGPPFFTTPMSCAIQSTHQRFALALPRLLGLPLWLRRRFPAFPKNRKTSFANTVKS